MTGADDADPGPSWRLVTPATSAGAVACLELVGDVEEAFRRLGLAPVAVGELRLRALHGLDHALIARMTPNLAHVMPHGGIAAVRVAEAALHAAGIRRLGSVSPRIAFPEARTWLEACSLAWLAIAASPDAVDLLLDQPRRWRSAGWDPDAPPPRARNQQDRLLDRLLAPPLIVALGPPNVGKSTLLNALARRRVSIVADRPGTTRDHVGPMLDLDGLTVRYVDAPGIREHGVDPIEARAIATSLVIARSADLILHVSDHVTPWRLPAELAALPTLRVQTRTDLHGGDTDADIAVGRMHVAAESSATKLALAIRQRLVPREAALDPSPWVLPAIAE